MVDIVKLVMPCPFVGVGGVDVLCDVTAEMDVDDLKPFADAEHGLFLCHKAGEKPKLQKVELCVHVSGTVIRLAEKGGRNVAAAGEEQMRGPICGFVLKGGAVGDTQPFQRFFVIFCIFTAAGDDDGGERGHGGSFLQWESVILFYILCRRRRMA